LEKDFRTAGGRPKIVVISVSGGRKESNPNQKISLEETVDYGCKIKRFVGDCAHKSKMISRVKESESGETCLWSAL